MGKVVLLTGASGGIGKATAKLLTEKGFKVYGTVQDMTKTNGLEALGVKVVELDVTKEQSMVACVKHVLNIEGKIDVLVNNAGFGLYGSVRGRFH
jgi:NAD(P)-dependent dehydrogenase (short-subunit alcohol dehydrogenase family)